MMKRTYVPAYRLLLSLSNKQFIIYSLLWSPCKCQCSCQYVYGYGANTLLQAQRIARPDFWVRDRDFISRSLNDETRPRPFFFWVSISRRDRDFFFLSLNDETRPRLFFSWVSMSRQDRDFFLLSLNVETRPRLFRSLNIETRPRLLYKTW